MSFNWGLFLKMFLMLFGILCSFTFTILALENGWLMLGVLPGIVSISAAIGLEGGDGV